MSSWFNLRFLGSFIIKTTLTLLFSLSFLLSVCCFNLRSVSVHSARRHIYLFYFADSEVSVSLAAVFRLHEWWMCVIYSEVITPAGRYLRLRLSAWIRTGPKIRPNKHTLYGVTWAHTHTHTHRSPLQRPTLIHICVCLWTSHKLSRKITRICFCRV